MRIMIPSLAHLFSLRYESCCRDQSTAAGFATTNPLGIDPRAGWRMAAADAPVRGLRPEVFRRAFRCTASRAVSFDPTHKLTRRTSLSQTALTGLVTGILRYRSPRPCCNPAGSRRIRRQPVSCLPWTCLLLSLQEDGAGEAPRRWSANPIATMTRENSFRGLVNQALTSLRI